MVGLEVELTLQAAQNIGLALIGWVELGHVRVEWVEMNYGAQS